MINLEHFLKDISIIRIIGIFQCICGLLAMISEIMEISVMTMEKSCWIYGMGIWILSSAIFILSGGLVLTSIKYYNNNYRCCLGWTELYFSVLFLPNEKNIFFIKKNYFSYTICKKTKDKLPLCRICVEKLRRLKLYVFISSTH